MGLKDKEMEDVEEIIIQRTSEKGHPLSGQELYDETVKLLDEYIDKREKWNKESLKLELEVLEWSYFYAKQ